ncbi:hypothetical protein NKJ09_22835 [Mesorhizobium sp. M0189]|uniref:hypothetical protein n=1 Tax=Mesorhizobium sp. M0189 TaxID=2956909 RepID=UPI003338657B
MGKLRPVASDTLNPSDHYRKDSFRRGLERCGFEVGQPPKLDPDPSDVLVIWNRASSNVALAERYEEAGARVIVAENGYIGADRNGWQLYAIALGHHLGAGEWPTRQDDRWAALGIELRPWRRAGREIVILPQRGFGEPGIAMPKTWAEEVAERLKKVTDRPVRIRFHPGKARTDPLPDLQDAWAAVTWASGAGIKALVAGIPVFHEMPSWVGGTAAKFGIEDIEDPFLGDRLPMLRRLAWSQWTEAEIQEGTPFKCLLG